jgi:tRNA 2-thiouridine synthesizing protein E
MHQFDNLKGVVMEEADVNQTKVDDQLDCEGFITDMDFWSKDIAENLAKMHEIGEYRLSDDHWKVINFVRDFYNRHGSGPAIVKVVKHTGLSLTDICKLFPCGLVKGAYRLAGLPKPPGCT